MPVMAHTFSVMKAYRAREWRQGFAQRQRDLRAGFRARTLAQPWTGLSRQRCARHHYPHRSGVGRTADPVDPLVAPYCRMTMANQTSTHSRHQQPVCFAANAATHLLRAILSADALGSQAGLIALGSSASQLTLAVESCGQIGEGRRFSPIGGRSRGRDDPFRKIASRRQK